MLQKILIVLALVVLAIAFRTCRRRCLRKIGALLLLVASFLGFAFLTNSWYLGILGVAAWFLLPWIEILTQTRKQKISKKNRLTNAPAPEDEFFPNASQALKTMSNEGFEHVSDAAWSWSGMTQYFRLHWNPQERAMSSVCLCEKERVAFAFIMIKSQTEDGRIFQTTNFPFSPTLKNPPHLHISHVPCERNSFTQILADHRSFLNRQKVDFDDLCIPDPDELPDDIEKLMMSQIEHNLHSGILQQGEQGEDLHYSKRGLLFLWGQLSKDMIRLC